MIAFDRPLENDAFGPEDYLPAPKLATEEDFALKEFLDQAIKGSGLNEKEQHVVMEYFFKDRTNEEIGEDFSQSRQNMQSILKGALKKLRQGPYAERLKDFL
jgi:RNA polymerase sigma factor (sigma-70 family)